jgi:hypothetical protein
MVNTADFPAGLWSTGEDGAAPTVLAAWGPAAIVLWVESVRVRAAVARFDPDLSQPMTAVLGRGAAQRWETHRLLALPDGRFVLFSIVQGNHYLDAATLEVVRAADLAAEQEGFRIDEGPYMAPALDAVVLGDRLLLGHGVRFGAVRDFLRFTARPLTGPVPASPWLRDLDQQLRDRGIWASTWYVRRAAALANGLVLACQDRRRSGSSDHCLLRVTAEGRLTELRRDDRQRIRDDSLELIPDHPRGLIYVTVKGGLEIMDPTLATVAKAPDRHPFLRDYRVLAGDGRGRLLWRGNRRQVLVTTDPDELDPADLAGSLDRLAAEVAARVGTGRPVRRSRTAATGGTAAGPKPPGVTRHSIPLSPPDLARSAAQARERLESLLRAAPPVAQPLQQLADAGREMLAAGSVLYRDDPILHTAVRSIAQARTGQLVAVATGQRVPVEIAWGDEMVPMITTRPSLDVGHAAWCEAWYAAHAARDDRCMALLAAVADDTLTDNRHTRYMVPWRKALLAVHRGTGADEVAALVGRAIGLAEPASFTTNAVWRAHRWQAAIHPMLIALANGDKDGLNAALMAALKAHKVHHGVPPHAKNSEGWVALGPLALCCLARDRGIDIRVESDYLLPHLIERRY